MKDNRRDKVSEDLSIRAGKISDRMMWTTRYDLARLEPARVGLKEPALRELARRIADQNRTEAAAAAQTTYQKEKEFWDHYGWLQHAVAKAHEWRNRYIWSRVKS